MSRLGEGGGEERCARAASHQLSYARRLEVVPLPQDERLGRGGDDLREQGAEAQMRGGSADEGRERR
eukprot:6132074-Prymnesium_polylepis.2